MTGVCGIVAKENNIDLPAEFARMFRDVVRFPHHKKFEHHTQHARIGGAYLELDELDHPSPSGIRIGPWLVIGKVRLDQVPDKKTVAKENIESTNTHQSPTHPLYFLGTHLVNGEYQNLSRCFGDWTVIAYHQDSNELRIAQQPYGSCTLYYANTKQAFVFSNSMGSLLNLDFHKFEIDEFSMARQLTYWGEKYDETVFDEIKRLPNAHVMVLRRNEMQLVRYWQMESDIQPINITYEDAIEETRRLLRKAVVCRIPYRGKVASMLSSGLDSGAVSGVCANHLASSSRQLSTYCTSPLNAKELVHMHGRCGDETSAAQQVAEQYHNVRFTSCDSADMTPLQGIKLTVDATSLPFISASNDYWLHSMMRVVANDGNQILFNGQMGNTTFSWRGVPTLWHQIRVGHWRAVAGRVAGHPALAGFRDWQSLRSTNKQPWLSVSPVNKALGQRFNIHKKMRAEGYRFATGAHLSDSALDIRLSHINPDLGTGDMWAHFASTSGVRIVDPTADTELILFTLSLPDHLFAGPRAQPRWLARQVTEPWLPHNIRYSNSRGLQAADVHIRLRNDAENVSNALRMLSGNPLVNHYLDISKLKNVWRVTQTEDTVQSWSLSWKVLLRGLAFGFFLLQHSP